jgi:hypothetical protein
MIELNVLISSHVSIYQAELRAKIDKIMPDTDAAIRDKPNGDHVVQI